MFFLVLQILHLSLRSGTKLLLLLFGTIFVLQNLPDQIQDQDNLHASSSSRPVIVIMSNNSPVQYELLPADNDKEASVAVLTLNDGKMNAFSFNLIRSFNVALDKACHDKAGSVVIIGNKKALSAGFDLSIMGKGAGLDVAELFREGLNLMIRLFEFERPTIMASPGHALALGAIMLLTGDFRLGVKDHPKAKIGMNEVAIGMTVPKFAMQLAKHRMPASHVPRSTTLAEIYNTQSALEACYFDKLVSIEHLRIEAIKEGKRLGMLRNPGFKKTKQFERGNVIAIMRSSVPEEYERMLGKKQSKL